MQNYTLEDLILVPGIDMAEAIKITVKTDPNVLKSNDFVFHTNDLDEKNRIELWKFS